MYNEDNDSQIVNVGTQGAPDGTAHMPTNGEHAFEKAWVGRCWAQNYGGGAQLDPEIQKSAIKDGAMYEYVKALKIYRCPTGLAGELLTYAGMDGVNGLSRSNQGTKQDVHWIKNSNTIRRPHSRILFIDEGWVTPDSFAVHFSRTPPVWWDDPPARHGGGVSLSYADGHSSWHKWIGSDTVKLGLERTIGHSNNAPPGNGLVDLQMIQKGCWGELGY
jgi:prepilin-type processing-associated H-X9-DG protein